MTEPTFDQLDDAITLEQQLACVEREIAIRRRVYPTRVACRRMTERQAGRELAAMRAVATTLRGLIERYPTDGA